MRWAAGQLPGERLVDRLFAAYFEEGQDIGDIDILAECAAASGLDRDGAYAFLIGDEEREAVRLTDEQARQGGIGGVPYFIFFDRRYALAGAQEPTSFLPLFDALAINDPEMISSRS